MKHHDNTQSSIDILYKCIDKLVKWLELNPNHPEKETAERFLKQYEEELEWYKTHFDEYFI